MPRAILLGAAVITFAGGAWAALSPEDAGLSLLLVAVALIAFGFAWLESGPGSAKEVALVAVLGGAVVLCATALVDEYRSLPRTLRFVVQLAV
ncbi:MAG: hypothetical protein ACRDM9_09165, partial [Gaiellaceae bacterium]